jgi:hypothetical protein
MTTNTSKATTNKATTGTRKLTQRDTTCLTENRNAVDGRIVVRTTRAARHEMAEHVHEFDTNRLIMKRSAESATREVTETNTDPETLDHIVQDRLIPTNQPGADHEPHNSP